MSQTPNTDDLVAAARAASRTGTPQVVPAPTEGFERVYLPAYGRHFDLPAGVWPASGPDLVTHAEALLVAGNVEQASAAADHALTTSLPADLRARAHRVHLTAHETLCCVVHGNHAQPHRRCVLR